MRNKLLTIECLVLFALLPFAVALVAMGRPIVFYLWPFAVACAAVLFFDRNVPRSVFWNWAPVPGGIKKVLARFALFSVLTAAVVALYAPDRFMAFPRSRPAAWIMVMILYPLLSVYPQCVVYRAFFFNRYRRLFAGEKMLVLFAALAFAWTHVVFRNAPALLLSFAGGLMFAGTYASSRSLALAFIEHSIYGCMLFTTGAGFFFYHGAVR